MCGEQGFIAVRETVHLVQFIGKGCPIFFSSAYVTLLSTTYAIQLPILFMCRHLAGSKKIIFIRMSWRRRMKIQIPVCANIGVLFTLDILS